jgi:acetyl-CoA acyltransferase
VEDLEQLKMTLPLVLQLEQQEQLVIIWPVVEIIATKSISGVNNMQNDVYLVYAKRSAIGSFGGTLATLRVDDMLAQLFIDLKTSFDFPLTEIDDVIIGCANQAGEDNRNLARMSLLLAGFPYEVPATTINRLCGSSLDAVIGAYARIKAGLGECFIAGGAESMSRAPYVMSKAESAYARDQKMWDTSIGWRFPNPKMADSFHCSDG